MDNPLSNYIIGILVFSLVIVSGVSLMSIMKANNDEHLTKFNETFNKLETVSGKVTDLQAGVESNENQDPGVWGFLNSIFNKIWQTIRLITSSFSFMGTAFSGLSSLFGIPSYVITVIISIITTILIFTIISLILNRTN